MQFNVKGNCYLDKKTFGRDDKYYLVFDSSCINGTEIPKACRDSKEIQLEISYRNYETLMKQVIKESTIKKSSLTIKSSLELSVELKSVCIN